MAFFDLYLPSLKSNFMISDDNVSPEPILAAETTIAMTPSSRKSMIAQLFEKESEVEVETLEDLSEVQTSIISTESEPTLNFDPTTPISVGAMTPASRKTMVAQLTKEDLEAQKSAQSSKGQLISKCPFGLIVWTKIPTIFFPKFLP